MKKQEAAAGTSSVKERVLKAYEVPVVLELGAVEDLTWTGSADFYVST